MRTLLSALLLCAAAIGADEAGLPVYSNAHERPDGADELATVTTGDLTVHAVAAGTWLSNDSPDRVLAYYRDRLKSRGNVIECDHGANPTYHVRLRAGSHARACDAGDFAVDGTELKVVYGGDQDIVVVRPWRDGGTEFALVHVRFR